MLGGAGSFTMKILDGAGMKKASELNILDGGGIKKLL